MAGCQSVNLKVSYRTILHSIDVEIITQKEDAMHKYRELVKRFVSEPSTWAGQSQEFRSSVTGYLELFADYEQADYEQVYGKSKYLNIVQVLGLARSNGTVFFSPSTLRIVGYDHVNKKLVQWEVGEWFCIDDDITVVLELSDWIEFKSPENVKSLQERSKEDTSNAIKE